LLFFKILSQKSFVEILTFDGGNSFRRTVPTHPQSDVFRRRLLISLISSVKKWNISFTPIPPNFRPRTAPSPGPFKIDQLNSRHRFYFYLFKQKKVSINQIQSFKR